MLQSMSTEVSKKPQDSGTRMILRAMVVTFLSTAEPDECLEVLDEAGVDVPRAEPRAEWPEGLLPWAYVYLDARAAGLSVEASAGRADVSIQNVHGYKARNRKFQEAFQEAAILGKRVD